MAATASLAVGQNKYGLDATALFTRGKPGDPEERGESMVQKHAAKLQQEKETAALARMSALLPQLGEVTRMLVLQETDWSVEQAQVVAKQFMEAHADKLAALQKARKKVLADAAAGITPGGARASDAARAGGGSDSDQAGSSGSSDDDGSGSDGGHDRKKRKHSSSKKGKASGEGKEKRSSRSGGGSKHKKHKRSRDKERDGGGAGGSGAAKALTHSENFGRFGVIRETDKSAKANEFMRWSMDVKKVSLETCGPTEERELFKAFMEDYNTGTMPHRKYYNLEIYERERALKAAKKAAKTGVKVSERPVSALEDMEEIRRQRMAERARVETERLAEAYKDLKYKGKAQDMREQELLRAQMALAYKTGDTETAKALAKRLEPVVIDDRIPKKR